MRGKEDGTKGRKIKQLPPPPLWIHSEWVLNPHQVSCMNIHGTGKQSISGSQNWTVGGEEVSPINQQHHLLLLGRWWLLSWARQCEGGQRECRASQGILNHQAVCPSHTRWLLCVSATEKEVPRWPGRIQFPSSQSSAFSPKATWPRCPQHCLERTGNGRAH